MIVIDWDGQTVRDAFVPEMSCGGGTPHTSLSIARFHNRD